MAKKRFISETLILDEEFNDLSVEAQNIFIRLLAVSDDCGVVPVKPKILSVMINCPSQINGKLSELVQEIVEARLGAILEYQNKRFFVFKPISFRRIQSWIVNKRVYSEYMKMPAKRFDELFSAKLNEMCNITPNDSHMKSICHAFEGHMHNKA